jgi:hypothetical protein
MVLIIIQIKFIRQKSFPDCKLKNKLRFDFYIPELNCCIEFDGEQHFRKTPVFGGEDGYEKLKLRDMIKNEFCEKIIFNYIELNIMII